jgi:hypothetical protein
MTASELKTIAESNTAKDSISVTNPITNDPLNANTLQTDNTMPRPLRVFQQRIHFMISKG